MISSVSGRSAENSCQHLEISPARYFGVLAGIISRRFLTRTIGPIAKERTSWYGYFRLEISQRIIPYAYISDLRLKTGSLWNNSGAIHGIVPSSFNFVENSVLFSFADFLILANPKSASLTSMFFVTKIL